MILRRHLVSALTIGYGALSYSSHYLFFESKNWNICLVLYLALNKSNVSLQEGFAVGSD